VTDAHSGKSWRSVLNDGAPLPAEAGSGWTRAKLPFSDARRWIAPAPAEAAARPPAVREVGQVRSGIERTLSVQLVANGNEEIELIAPEDANIRAAGVPGFIRLIDQDAGGKYYISCAGRSCDGVTVRLVVGQPEPVEFLVLGSRAALPPGAAALLAARPRLARPQYNPDATIAFARVKL